VLPREHAYLEVEARRVAARGREVLGVLGCRRTAQQTRDEDRVGAEDGIHVGDGLRVQRSALSEGVEPIDLLAQEGRVGHCGLDQREAQREGLFERCLDLRRLRGARMQPAQQQVPPAAGLPDAEKRNPAPARVGDLAGEAEDEVVEVGPADARRVLLGFSGRFA